MAPETTRSELDMERNREKTETVQVKFRFVAPDSARKQCLMSFGVQHGVFALCLGLSQPHWEQGLYMQNFHLGRVCMGLREAVE